MVGPLNVPPYPLRITAIFLLSLFNIFVSDNTEGVFPAPPIVKFPTHIIGISKSLGFLICLIKFKNLKIKLKGKKIEENITNGPKIKVNPNREIKVKPGRKFAFYFIKEGIII